MGALGGKGSPIGGGRVLNSDTVLLRQIHPLFVQQGRVTSQAFRPTPKDEHKLSVYDGDMISAGRSFHHYTTTLCFASAGVMGVSVGECNDLALAVSPDPLPFPEHVVIDYSAFEKNVVEKKAKLLKARAETRGWLFLDASTSSC
jgi:hypothetical protein